MKKELTCKLVFEKVINIEQCFSQSSDLNTRRTTSLFDKNSVLGCIWWLMPAISGGFSLKPALSKKLARSHLNKQAQHSGSCL
jgi:hypothetical protein